MQSAGRFRPSGALRSLAYHTLWSCANALEKSANACLYLAAGMLQQEDLRAASRNRWRLFGTSVDDTEAGLTMWERRLYGDVLQRSDRVLLVGCGTGRDLVALLELGYDVSGLEQTRELADLARGHLVRRGLSAAVRVGLIETWELDDTYDAVVFSNGCYSCLPHSASRVATLARIKAHLTREGRIVLTYTGLQRQSPLSIGLTRLGTALSHAAWRPERGDCFSRDHLAPRVLRYEHLFRQGEVARECADAGLRVVREEPLHAPLYCTVAVV